MMDFFESDSFLSPSEVRSDVAGRLKETRPVKRLELFFKGSSLEGTKEFAEALVSLRKQGVKISHEFSIKLDFPHAVNREKILSLVGNMPKPGQGAVKVRLEFNDNTQAPAATPS